MDTSLKEGLKYFSKNERLATYNSWIFTMNDPCNVEKMAEAGFIFIGNEDEPDAVKCFFCDKHLDGWEATDDPWNEHLKHSQKCLFANLQKPEGELPLKRFIELQFNLCKKIKQSYFNELSTSTNKLLKRLESRFHKI